MGTRTTMDIKELLGDIMNGTVTCVSDGFFKNEVGPTALVIEN